MSHPSQLVPLHTNSIPILSLSSALHSTVCIKLNYSQHPSHIFYSTVHGHLIISTTPQFSPDTITFVLLENQLKNLSNN